MRGRKKTPTAILKLHGSWRANERDEDLQPSVRHRLRCPIWLKGEARKHWQLIAPQLLSAGIVSALDRDMLGLYCQLYGQYLKSVIILEGTAPIIKNVAGNFVQNPIVKVVNQIADRLVSIGSQMGLTPAARAGMARRTEERQSERKEGVEKYVRTA